MIISISVPEAAANVRFLNSRRSISACGVRSAWNTKATTSAAPISAGAQTSVAPKPPEEADSARP